MIKVQFIKSFVPRIFNLDGSLIEKKKVSKNYSERPCVFYNTTEVYSIPTIHAEKYLNVGYARRISNDN